MVQVAQAQDQEALLDGGTCLAAPPLFNQMAAHACACLQGLHAFGSHGMSTCRLRGQKQHTWMLEAFDQDLRFQHAVCTLQSHASAGLHLQIIIHKVLLEPEVLLLRDPVLYISMSQASHPDMVWRDHLNEHGSCVTDKCSMTCNDARIGNAD